jgi:hypothetical protein
MVRRRADRDGRGHRTEGVEELSVLHDHDPRRAAVDSRDALRSGARRRRDGMAAVRARHLARHSAAGTACRAANALWTFREFDIIYASTRGGPAGATETLGILVYREAFESFRFGTAAAIGVLMLATAAIFVVLTMRVLRDEFR